MQITVIHNPGAGRGGMAKARLMRLLAQAGHEALYRSTCDKAYATAVATTRGLVVAAGGDGTVRRVAIALSRRNAPMAILPLGTANNVAGALGHDGEHRVLVQRWKKMRKRPMDLGLIETPAGRSRFIESVGIGWFSDTMAMLDRRRAKASPTVPSRLGQLREARAAFVATLETAKPFAATVTIDRKIVRGRFLLVEVMNLCRCGPGLVLAPHAHPGDGWLDVAMVRETERRRLLKYLTQPEGGTAAPPTVIRGRRIRIVTARRRVHVDDKPGALSGPRAHALGRGRMIRLEIQVERAPLEVLSAD